MGVNGWSLVRFAHVTAATVWVGGQLLLAGVVLPVLRRNAEQGERTALVRAVARRFAMVANAVVIPLLVSSGVALMWHRGVAIDELGASEYGRLLTTKLGFVVASVALAALHGALVRKRPPVARFLAVVGVIASLVVVVLATALVP